MQFLRYFSLFIICALSACSTAAQFLNSRTGTSGTGGGTTTTTPAQTGTTTQQNGGGRPGATTGSTGTTNNGGTGTVNTGRTPTTNNTNTNTGTNGLDFTQNEAAQAIKDALTKGIGDAVKKVNITDGYFKNAAIKIPFPSQAKQVETTLRSIGLGSMIDKVILTINRSAEDAAVKATPIFINSIKKMTITDAINIVTNKQPDAATQFLKRTTTEELVSSFKPAIKTALDKTLATKYWKDIMTQYNKVPLVSKVNTDLPDYVTRKAIDGLFYMVAQEEAKIRKDPLARTTDVLEKVFGSIKW